MRRGDNEGPSITTLSSCSRCKYFYKSLKCSGGLRGTSTFYLKCDHPDVLVDMGEHKIPRSLNGDRIAGQRTPGWCPYLQKDSSE